MSVNNLVKNTLEIINVKRRQQIINDSQIKNIFFCFFSKQWDNIHNLIQGVEHCVCEIGNIIVWQK